MEVLIDGKKADVDLNASDTVADLLAGVDHLLASDGRVRIQSVVDEQTVSSENKEEIESRSLGEVSEVSITSQGAEELARQTLMEAKKVLPDIRKRFEEVSIKMQGGKKEEAFELLQGNFIEWRNIIQLFSIVEGFLKVDYKITFVGEKTIDEINSDLLGLLSETKDAMVDSDLVTLSDLLEYEIAPRIEEQMRIIDELLK